MSRFSRSPAVLWRHVGDEVVLGLDEGDFTHLSPTAAAIWSLLEESRSIDEIVSELAEVYGDDPAIAPQTEALLDELAAAGLVVKGEHQ